MSRALLTLAARLVRALALLAAGLTLLSFLLGFHAHALLGDNFHIDRCRRELGFGNAPPQTEPVEVSGKGLPARAVCRWPDGTEVEVPVPVADEVTLSLLRATAVVGVPALLVTLLDRRIRSRHRPSASPSGSRAPHSGNDSKGILEDD